MIRPSKYPRSDVGPDADTVIGAYGKVFRGAGRPNTLASIVLQDLHDALVMTPPKDSYEAAVAAGRQYAYYYILDMIEAAEAKGLDNG